MAGLLDIFGGDPQSQGLLAAAAQILQASGPSRTPTSLGQILGGGLMAGQQVTQQARQQGQLEQLRGLQIKGAEVEMAQQQRALEEAERLRKFYSGTQSPPSAAAPAGLSSPGAPAATAGPATGAVGPSIGASIAGGNATQSWFERQMAEADALQGAGFVSRADAIRKQAIAFRGKAKWEIVKNGDKVSPMALFEDGTRGDTVDAAVAQNLNWQDTGRETLGLDPTFGTVVARQQNSMSPSQAAADAVARANLAVSQQRLALDRQNQGRPTYNESAGGFILPPSATNPNGAVIPLANPRGPKLTEDQGKATSWVVQAENAWQNMKKVAYGEDGKLTDAARPGIGDAIAALPLGIGEAAGNFFRSADRQKFNQAASATSEALLRAATGAGVNRDEAIQKTREITPVWGDSEEVIAQKMASIPLYLDSLRVRAGPGGALADGVVARNAAAQQEPPRVQPPRDAINHLKLNPKLRDAFDAKYGAGAAASVLGR